MRIRSVLFVALGVATLAVGLATGAGAMTGAQTRYVKAVRFLDPTVAGATNKQIDKAGAMACASLKKGTSIKKIAPSPHRKVVLVEAAAYLCPKYKGRVFAFYSPPPAPTTIATPTTVPPPPTTTTTTAPPPPPPTTTAPPPAAPSCSPLSDAGHCYDPGEYCRDSDHGMTGTAGDGVTITCENNNGWRWEPT